MAGASLHRWQGFRGAAIRLGDASDLDRDSCRILTVSACRSVAPPGGVSGSTSLAIMSHPPDLSVAADPHHPHRRSPTGYGT